MRGVNNGKVDEQIRFRQTSLPLVLQNDEKADLDIFFPLTAYTWRTTADDDCRRPPQFLEIHWRTPITFSNYIKQLVGVGLSSSLALGLVVGILLLITGGTTAEIDLTLEFGAFFGFWFVIGLPILTILICLIISPLSFGIHRLPSLWRKDETQEDGHSVCE